MTKTKKILFIILGVFLSTLIIMIPTNIYIKSFVPSLYDATTDIITLPNFYPPLFLVVWGIIIYFIGWKVKTVSPVKKERNAPKKEVIQSIQRKEPSKKVEINKVAQKQKVIEPIKTPKTKEQIEREKLLFLAHDVLVSTEFDKPSAYEKFRSITGYDFNLVSKIIDYEYNNCNDEIKQMKKDNLVRLQREQKEKNSIARCPKCGSTSLSAHKKGFGIGKAVVGAATVGAFGLVAGNLGAKKVRVTCMNCGKQFWAGKQ